ncbi:MAG: hypothetical protein WDN28_16135 [Chthoniobacter sp.]
MKRFALLALCLLGAITLRADDPATFPVGGLTFKRPADWAWVPVSSPMRKAQLKVPGTKPNEAAEITFFHFGPDGGGDIQSNAQRWVSQFRGNENAAKIEEQEIGGAKVTLVSTEGTYSSGMPGGPTTTLENYALLGAIIEHPEGNVFVKMTGPAPLVKDSRKKFLDFLATAFPAK